MENEIFIFGNGETAEMANYYFAKDSKYSVVGFTVDDEHCFTESFLGLPLVSWSSFNDSSKEKSRKLHIALSYRRMNEIRHEKFLTSIKNPNIELVSYISSRSYVANNVELGRNVMILENQVIQNNVSISDNVMLWSGNHIGHGTIIGTSTYLASHVVISGHSKIGNRCFFGVNSATRDFIKVGDNCLVGMNASVTQDMPNDSVILAPQSILFEGEKATRIQQKATGI